MDAFTTSMLPTYFEAHTPNEPSVSATYQRLFHEGCFSFSMQPLHFEAHTLNILSLQSLQPTNLMPSKDGCIQIQYATYLLLRKQAKMCEPVVSANYQPSISWTNIICNFVFQFECPPHQNATCLLPKAHFKFVKTSVFTTYQFQVGYPILFTQTFSQTLLPSISPISASW